MPRNRCSLQLLCSVAMGLLIEYPFIFSGLTFVQHTELPREAESQIDITLLSIRFIPKQD